MLNTTPHTTTHKENLNRLARIEGQVRGVRRMVEQGAYCVDILTQIQAVQSALGSVANLVLEKHLDHCVTEALQSESPADARGKIDEVMALLKKRGARRP